MIALDIDEHFKKKVRPNGFKGAGGRAQQGRRAAILGFLRDFGVSAYPIITTSPQRRP